MKVEEYLKISTLLEGVSVCVLQVKTENTIDKGHLVSELQWKHISYLFILQSA